MGKAKPKRECHGKDNMISNEPKTWPYTHCQQQARSYSCLNKAVYLTLRCKGGCFCVVSFTMEKTLCTVIFDLLISLVVSFPQAYLWEFSAGGFQHFEIILHSVPPSISSLYCGTSNFLPQILCLLQLEHNLDITLTALV